MYPTFQRQSYYATIKPLCQKLFPSSSSISKQKLGTWRLYTCLRVKRENSHKPNVTSLKVGRRQHFSTEGGGGVECTHNIKRGNYDTSQYVK